MAPSYDVSPGFDSESEESCPSEVSLDNPMRFLFKPAPGQRERLRAGDLIIFLCPVMGAATKATMMSVDPTARIPLRLYPIRPLPRDTLVTRLATRDLKGELVEINGKHWPIKFFDLEQGQIDETVRDRLNQEGEDFVKILESQARKTAEATGNPLIENIVSDKFQSKDRQTDGLSGMVVPSAISLKDADVDDISSSDEEEENAATKRLNTYDQRLKQQQSVVPRERSLLDFRNTKKKPTATSSNLGNKKKKQEKKQSVASTAPNQQSTIEAPTKPSSAIDSSTPFISPPFQGNVSNFFAGMPSQAPVAAPNPFSVQMPFLPGNTNSLSTLPGSTIQSQQELQQWAAMNIANGGMNVGNIANGGMNIANGGMFPTRASFMNHGTAPSLPLVTTKKTPRLMKGGSKKRKISSKKSQSNGTTSKPGGRKPGAGKYGPNELGRLVLAAHAIVSSGEQITEANLKKAFDEEPLEEGEDRTERSGKGLMSRYTKLSKTNEDDKECGDYVKLIKQLQNEEAMQNHVLTSVQPESTSNEDEEGDEVDQVMNGPKVPTNSDSRAETLKRRLQKQKEQQVANNEKVDIKALIATATELLQSAQTNESSSGNHVETTEMKHKIEDLEDTVGSLKGTVGNLNQVVQEMSTQLSGVHGLLQKIVSKLEDS